MDKQSVWILSGDEQLVKVYATRELALASLQLSYSETNYTFETAKLGEDVFGIAIKKDGAAEEDRFIIALYEVLHTIDHV